MAEFSNFGSTLDNMLRDRLICGINESKIQQRLLAMKKPTLKEGFDLAQSLETAAENVKQLSGSADQEAAANMHAMAQSTKNNPTDMGAPAFAVGRQDTDILVAVSKKPHAAAVKRKAIWQGYAAVRNAAFFLASSFIPLASKKCPILSTYCVHSSFEESNSSSLPSSEAISPLLWGFILVAS